MKNPVTSSGRLCLALVVVLQTTLWSEPLQAKTVVPDIKEGAWRVAVQMEIPNATGPDTGPVQYDRCMSPDKLEGLLLVPPGAPCTVKNSRLEKKSLTWEMHCSQGGFSSVANGRILFKGTQLEGQIHTLARGPQALEIKTTIEGRYLGPCVSADRPASPPSRSLRLRPYPEAQD